MIRAFPSNVMISPPLLPPRGIFIPTRLIFHPQLPPAVLLTWIQLRCLAWDGWSVPPLTIPELASLLDIHPPRLNRHLSLLRSISALRWRSTWQGTITISFSDEPSDKPENQPGSPNFKNSKVLNSTNSESLDPRSYFPQRILGYLSYQEDQEGFLTRERPEDLGNFEDLKSELARNKIS